MCSPRLPTALPFIGEGRLRALATTGQDRSQALPDVPTVAEAMLPNFALYAWLGLVRTGRICPRRSRQAQQSGRDRSAASRDGRSGCAHRPGDQRAARRRTWARISIASSTAGRSSPSTSRSKSRNSLPSSLHCARPSHSQVSAVPMDNRLTIFSVAERRYCEPLLRGFSHRAARASLLTRWRAALGRDQDQKWRKQG